MGNGMTYEAQNNMAVLETFEWDRTWIHKTGDTQTPRVLYVGDSISVGICGLINGKANGEINFDFFSTSKSLDNPVFQQSLQLFASQEPKRDVIAFNNGLHGWHLTEEEYKAHYEKMLCFLMEQYPESVILPVLSTTVKNQERNNRVVARNEKVMELAEKYNLQTLDLFTVSTSNGDIQSDDGVHFKADGYYLFCDVIIEKCREMLG
ncbi:MAG: hypothetical protein E7421_05630 [Ruminococcaceae bacterium]|nr:hypothetical protein [Oscillospiraceae bacterium]